MLVAGWLIFLVLSLHSSLVESFSIEDLKTLAVEIDLNILLASHLAGEFRSEFQVLLNELVQSMVDFEKVFYDPRVLKGYCTDPNDDILTTAFKEDTVNPFAEKYIFKMLPLNEVDEELGSITTFIGLKQSGRFDEVVNLIFSGKLHFKFEHYHGYMVQVKAHVRHLIVKRAKALLLERYENQTDSTADYKNLARNFNILNADIDCLDSYLIMENARKIFIHLPYIKFERKRP